VPDRPSAPRSVRPCNQCLQYLQYSIARGYGERRATIEWQFTAREARIKLAHLYSIKSTELG